MTTREQNWLNGYEALKHYIEEHKQLPDKKKVENRGLLNWWKYNKKRMKQGALDAEKVRLLTELSNMRDIKQQNIQQQVACSNNNAAAYTRLVAKQCRIRTCPIRVYP